GSRGAAGVLLITTKRGKSGVAKISYDGWFGSTKAVRLPEVFNAEQYIAFKNKAITNVYESNPTFAAANLPQVGFAPMLDENGNTIDTRWYDYIYQNGLSNNHNLNVSGGNDRTTYYFSGNLSDQN